MKRPQNAYEREIAKITDVVLTLGGKVAEELDLSLEALIDHDKDKARKVVEMDRVVDEINSNLEFKVFDLISLQQPLTKDLLKMVAAMRAGRELERFGDYAVNVAEAAIYLAGTGKYFKPLEDIPKMARMVGDLLQLSLKACSTADIELAENVFKRDDAVDELFKALHDELIEYMKKGSRYVEQGSYFLLIARYLERMGDHAVNVAQMAKFTITGGHLINDRHRPEE